MSHSDGIRMITMKTLLTVLIGLQPFSFLKPLLLNALGHAVHPSARIGLSVIRSQSIKLGRGARIGHFNFVSVPVLWMGRFARMRHMNRISGTFSMRVGAEGFLGSRNEIISGRNLPGPVYSRRCLIGPKAEITTFVFIDVCDSVSLHANTVLAGRGIQIWTHGFVHRIGGGKRELVRGPVRIGRNCYIGTMTCINYGIAISDDITVGSLSSVAKSLTEPGVYVGSRLRFIDKTPDQRLHALDRREGPDGPAYYRQSDNLSVQ